MSEPAVGQKQTTVLLIAMVVLLAVIVGVLVWQNARPGTQVPAATSTMPPNDAAGLNSGMPSDPMTAMPTTPQFDPATAPVVPEGVDLAEYVRSYHEACEAKDYERAFTLLPIATQQTYGSADVFEQTLEGYGISDFSVDEPVVEDGEAIVVGYQVAQGMTFVYEWLFVENDEGQWLVAARTNAGTR